eukprot:COSAG01_NODE_180_length_22910_cov_19.255710_11_plen_96_part_00
MSRATNSFAHIDITADNATPEEASKIHRKALRTHIQVLIDGLNGSATRDEHYALRSMHTAWAACRTFSYEPVRAMDTRTYKLRLLYSYRSRALCG